MQQTPLSQRTNAPASKVPSPPLLSFYTAAVNPATVAPLACTYTERGAIIDANCNSYDLPKPGSLFNIIFLKNQHYFIFRKL